MKRPHRDLIDHGGARGYPVFRSTVALTVTVSPQSMMPATRPLRAYQIW
jgi:hypothetical protein